MFHRMMNYGEMEARPTVALTRELIKKSMPKFKRIDDLIIIQEPAWEEFKRALPIPVVREENSPFSVDEDELASLVCQTVPKPICRRLAVDRGVKNDDYRTPDVELILGDTGIVTHKENHIIYRFDFTKCMFSFGNITEKMRMADLDCSEEIVVDLFVGIGYFSLPLLVHAKAKHLYACEWNPAAVEAFKKNILLNKIEPARCTVIEGDNRSNRPTDVAQRVILGILPSSIDWMKTAFECIDKSTGAILHCHDLVESKPQPSPTTTSLGERQTSMNLIEMHNMSSSTTDNNTRSPSMNQSLLLNQSVSSTSSSASHSTLEKLSVPSSENERGQSSESDKETSSSPVFLEKPSELTDSVSSGGGASAGGGNLNDTSSSSSHYEDSINELPIQITDHEQSAYESRAQAFIARIKEDVEAHDLRATLLHIRPVKSYAPHINHVVFDIKIEPKSAAIGRRLPEFPGDVLRPTSTRVESHQESDNLV